MPTLAQTIHQTQAQLEAQKDVAPREARDIILHLMQLEEATITQLNETQFPKEKQEALQTLLQRRLNGEPLQYLLGHAWFYGRKFTVTPAVLIPRPDTETLVEACLNLLPKAKPATVLEIGTGSGCIAATLLAERPLTTLTAVEISPAAAQIAQTNIAAYASPSRFHLLVQNALNPLPEGYGGPYTLLVSNPPYIRDDEWQALEPDVRLHEPKTALTGDAPNPDGLHFYRHLAQQGASLVARGGHMCLEIGWQQAQAVQHLLQEQGNAVWTHITLHADLAGRNRVLSAQRA